MAPRLAWSLHRNLFYPTPMSGRVLFIEAMAIYNSQGRIHYSTPILSSPALRLDLTPQILQSTVLCARCIRAKLYTMGIDNDSINRFTPQHTQLTSSVIDVASRYGNNVGFCLIAKLEFIWDDDSPVFIPINVGGGHGGDHIIHGRHTVMHDGDGGVIIVMDAEDLVEQQQQHQPKGASKSVIDKLRNKGRLLDHACADGDDVNGTCCPVCLEDFLPKTTEVLRMPCSHLFHDHCIVRWLQGNNSCPMCRKVAV